jgi:hypothetical protein
LVDIQAFIVALIVAAAALYLALRAGRRLRSFRPAAAGSSACETGCGRCEGAAPAKAPARLVRIERAGLASRRPVRTQALSR